MGARRTKEEFLAIVVSLVVLSVGGAASLLPAHAAEPGFYIEVSADQRISLSGEAASLAAMMEELAWRAGFELRGFDADDGPVALHIKDRPLWQALPRLLAGRSFLAGTTPVGKREQQRLIWLRVLGPHDRATENRRVGHGPARVAEGFRVPPSLFLAAFGSGRGETERRAALRSIAAQITRNSDQRRAFLETDPGRIAEALREYPKSAAMLAQLAEHQHDVALKEKLSQVLALLDPGRGSPLRGRAVADASARR